MATSVITHTVTDGSGTVLASVPVVARLMPGGRGFRSDGSECIGYEATTTNGSGVASLTLENNASIASPTDSWWEVEIQATPAQGGPSVWAIQAAGNATLYASRITPSNDTGLEAHLTQTLADARYSRLSAGVTGNYVSVKDTAYGATGDGSTDDTAAIQAAIDAVFAGGGGTVFIPSGSYKITSQLSVSSKLGLVIMGAGYTSQIKLHGTMTAGLKITDSSRTALRDLRFTSTSGTTTYAVHITRTSASTQQVDVSRVIVDVSGGTLTNAFAVGADTSQDVSEISFYGCRATGYDSAGWRLGAGSSGNVLNIRAFGCAATGGATSDYGVYMNGAVIQWFGGTTQNHTVSDFELQQANTQPIVVDGVRSESSERFWNYDGLGTVARTVTLANVMCRAFTDADGEVISHHGSAPLTLISCSFQNGTVAPVEMSLTANSSYPLAFTAINCVTDSEPGVAFGSSTTCRRTIIGYRKYESTITSVSVAPANGETFHTEGSALVNGSFINTKVITFADADATPSVLGGNLFLCDNTGATSITDFDDGVDGQVITIRVDGNTTIVRDSNIIRPAGAVNFVGSTNDLITFVSIGGIWYETARSVN